jgi:hypothetical protein
MENNISDHQPILMTLKTWDRKIIEQVNLFD